MLAEGMAVLTAAGERVLIDRIFEAHAVRVQVCAEGRNLPGVVAIASLTRTPEDGDRQRVQHALFDMVTRFGISKDAARAVVAAAAGRKDASTDDLTLDQLTQAQHAVRALVGRIQTA